MMGVPRAGHPLCDCLCKCTCGDPVGVHTSLHFLQTAFEAQGISPSISETYPATDMEAAIEAVTGVRDSSIVNCKNGEVDEVRHWPAVDHTGVGGAANDALVVSSWFCTVKQWLRKAGKTCHARACACQ